MKQWRGGKHLSGRGGVQLMDQLAWEVGARGITAILQALRMVCSSWSKLIIEVMVRNHETFCLHCPNLTYQPTAENLSLILFIAMLVSLSQELFDHLMCLLIVSVVWTGPDGQNIQSGEQISETPSVQSMTVTDLLSILALVWRRRPA